MIVIVEDDNSIQELISYTFTNQGYQVKSFYNGENLINFLKEYSVTIVILDIMLPGKSGIELLSEIRSDSLLDDVYIIMLTAKGDEYSKILALDKGADDYITKPFSVLELLSRVKAAFRRIKKNSKNDYLYYKDLKIDTVGHSVYLNNNLVELTVKEYKLLVILMENRGRVILRDTLLDNIWGYNLESSRTLDVHISSLRSKLKSISADIETVRGLGYRIRWNYDKKNS